MLAQRGGVGGELGSSCGNAGPGLWDLLMIATVVTARRGRCSFETQVGAWAWYDAHVGLLSFLRAWPFGGGIQKVSRFSMRMLVPAQQLHVSAST